MTASVKRWYVLNWWHKGRPFESETETFPYTPEGLGSCMGEMGNKIEAGYACSAWLHQDFGVVGVPS